MAAPSAGTKPSRSASKGPRRPRGVVVASGREGPHHREAAQPELAKPGLRTAADHDVGGAAPDHFAGVADGLRAGRAGGHDGVVEAAQAELHGDVGGGHVGAGCAAGRTGRCACRPARLARRPPSRHRGSRRCRCPARRRSARAPPRPGPGRRPRCSRASRRRRAARKRAMRRAALRSMWSRASKPRTSPPIRQGKPVVSKQVIAPMPLCPPTRPVQKASTPSPSGVIAPSPVMKTRGRESVIALSVGCPAVGCPPVRCPAARCPLRVSWSRATPHGSRSARADAGRPPTCR